jgi:hypothetical protein
MPGRRIRSTLKCRGGKQCQTARKQTREKQEALHQHRRHSKKKAKPLSELLHPREQSNGSMAESPFRPPLEKHAALLSEARSEAQRSNIVLRLQRTYGNTYVQRLFGTMAIEAKMTVNPPGWYVGAGG